MLAAAFSPVSSRLIALPIAALVAACTASTAPSAGPQPATPASPAADTPAPETSAPPAAPATPQLRCDTKADPDADRAVEEGHLVTEAVEAGVIDEYTGYAQQLELYKKAASAGHLEGQYLAGKLSFSLLFLVSEPLDSEREAYVEAIYNLIVAAARGHEHARTIFPDLRAILATGRLPAELAMPLSDVPRAWLEEAVALARRWDCFPNPEESTTPGGGNQ